MAKMGRPSAITAVKEEIFAKAFRDGATVLEASKAAEVSPDAYYDRMTKDPDFADKMNLSKEYVTEFAKALLSRKIQRGDTETAKWWLERKAKKEFSSRTEVSGPDGESLKIEIIEDTTLKDANEDSSSDQEL